MTTRPMMSTLLAALFALIPCVLGQGEGYVSGVQAQFGDVSYAGSMAWDSLQDLVYVTGQVGNNGCYVGVLKRSNLQFVSKLILPEPAICQDILLGNTETTAMILATTEEGGLLTNTRVPGSTKATQYGLLFPLHWSSGDSTKVTMPPGRLFHEDFVQYPRSIVKDLTPNSNFVYAVSLHSEDKSLNADFLASDATTPNLTPGGELMKYGSNFFLQVERLKYNALDGVEFDWRKPYGLKANAKDHSVHVANGIIIKDALLIAGSTRGSGPAFGDSESDEALTEGFMTKLDPESGNLWTKSLGVRRYTAPFTDTIIEAVCASSKDADTFFITGHYRTSSEASEIKSEPFVAKIDSNTMETLWEEQYLFTKDAVALACGVDEAQGYVYVAGTVKDGGTFGADTVSLGGDDLFAVQVETADGHANWVRQFGTQGKDSLAHAGNGLIVVGDGKGILVMGDTNGDFMATNQKGTEIVLISLDASGNVPPTAETQAGNENDGGSLAVTQPILIGNDATDDGGQQPVDPGTPVDPNEPNDTEDDIDRIKDRGGTGGGIGMMVMIGVVVLVFLLGYCLRSQKQEKVTERALVFSYLQAFDMEDIDVRHSATGGWHGTYAGKLAKGEGKGADGLTSSSHSSIVKDSLFVDYDTKTPAFGGDDGEGNLSNFRIDEQDEEEDQDFENIGRLEADMQPANGKEGPGGEWGTDII